MTWGRATMTTATFDYSKLSAQAANDPNNKNFFGYTFITSEPEQVDGRFSRELGGTDVGSVGAAPYTTQTPAYEATDENPNSPTYLQLIVVPPASGGGTASGEFFSTGALGGVDLGTLAPWESSDGEVVFTVAGATPPPQI